MLEDRLRKSRQEKGFTQAEMAKQLGIARTTYVGYETEGVNHRDPDDETSVKISKILDVTTDYLLGSSNLPHLTESESKSLRSLKDIRDDIANDRILDVDGKPFTPERKEEVLRQIDLLIRLAEVEEYKK